MWWTDNIVKDLRSRKVDENRKNRHHHREINNAEERERELKENP